MSQEQFSGNLSLRAPCIVENGLIVNPSDIQRLLTDLSRVRYIHERDGSLVGEGEGAVVEVLADPKRATIVANSALYLNVCSFDYLRVQTSSNGEIYFDLIQDNWQLRLIPLSNPLQDQMTQHLDAAALEAVVAEVLSASWDVRGDDDDTGLSS